MWTASESDALDREIIASRLRAAEVDRNDAGPSWLPRAVTSEIVLRAERGMSPGDIARELPGVTRDAVYVTITRYYAEIRPVYAPGMIEPGARIKQPCAHCGVPFPPAASRGRFPRRFCSARCRSTSNTQKRRTSQIGHG